MVLLSTLFIISIDTRHYNYDLNWGRYLHMLNQCGGVGHNFDLAKADNKINVEGGRSDKVLIS